MEKMFKPNDDQTRGEWVFVILLRIIAGAYGLIILYLPAVSRLSFDIENVMLTQSDVIALTVCGMTFAKPGVLVGKAIDAFFTWAGNVLSKLGGK